MDTLRVHGYEDIALIAQGAGFQRYRAVRVCDGLPVSLKLLHADETRIADVARLKHEYHLIARVHSPRVVEVHGVEEHDRGLLIVLDDVRAPDLQSVLGGRKRLEIGEFLDRAIAMAEAVDDLHRHDLIHGELNPKSVLLGDGAGAMLWNFGIDATVTRANEAIYSPAVLTEILPYISPEQTGRMNRTVDRRSDLYSLGVLFYEMLVGRKPFSASDPMELIHAHIAVLPVPPAALESSVPAALDAITRKLLSKNAEDRYQSASGLCADLEECRRQWRISGRVDDFPLGRRDRSKQLQIPQRLYGREEDIRALTASFERVLGGQREIVLVSGYSGTGKSSLVQEILRPLARERGYYISGKYDQYNREKPHGALIQAFEALLRQLLSESEERLAQWRAALLRALGKNAQVICDILPTLRLVLGDVEPVSALDPIESQNRFNLAFQRFVSVFARPAHPLAIFLDDLQWIDAASLGLLQAILADDCIEALFFCGAYRDNEVSSAHPFLRAVEALGKGGLGVCNIVLTPLGLEHLTELIEDSLHRGGARPLAEVVLEKTDGNPFLVKQLLKTLDHRKLLTLDPAEGWRWDLAAARALPCMHNGEDLMLDTLRRLPSDTQRMLELASTIGDRFDLGLLSAASDRSPDVAYESLAPALEEGLIARIGDGFRFTHDKIQEAATSMVPAEQRAESHHRIGRLLQQEAVIEEGRRLFDIVDHLNSSGDVIHDRAERVELARLNLQAAERLEESGAFHAALLYAEHGLARLPVDAWSATYALSLALTMKKGLMQSLEGRYDPALATLADALAHATGRRDQTEVRRLRMSVHSLKNDLVAAIDEGLAGLSIFDIRLPRFPSDEELEAELRATFAELGDRSIDSFAELPALRDPEIEALQNLLEELWAPCYLMTSNNFGITVMKILQSSMRHGTSKSTIHALLNFGTFLCTGRDLERGYAFGRAAVRLNERRPSKQIEPMLCNMWSANIQHWKEPYAASKEMLVRGIHLGIERAQFIFAFYNLKNSTVNNLLRGVNLHEMLAELSSYLPLCRLDAANAVTWMAKAIGQICHNLTHPMEAGHRLVGDWVDVEPIVASAREVNNQVVFLVADF
ncbi:ATP-binding protein [Polyangium aurulentum]|uniref:ATP-binding protein n=1 Tax=Polyangium aurulentum TaxID=2567896 RepID=UPI00200E65C8|nr:serine/threonine-protein kinase PknK [Polyangium aurulentum]UQA56115.1 serine/threonine-protein kinase PknK [Polyangium aurulentum]